MSWISYFNKHNHLQRAYTVSFFRVYFMEFMSHNFFNQSYVDRLLGCFHSLAIVNNAGMNTFEFVSEFSLDKCRRVVWLGYKVNSIFTCLRTIHTDLHSGSPGLPSYQQCNRVTFSCQPCQHLSFCDLLM